MKIGVVHGRFQPIHKGHIDGYINLARAKCDHLIIGITNPDPTHTLPDPINASRTSPQNNPLTFYERLTLVQAALIENGFSRNDFHIVPFPINFPQLLRYYVPDDATHFLTIFDEWGRKKQRHLEVHGYKVEVLVEKDISEKIISATDVRDRILRSRNWKELTPISTHRLLERMLIKDRIRRMKELAL
ncbi:MAG: nicotinate-nucleotide adenylyltransferase [Lysobacter sp.]|nr:MAG: nicotinate-nucleotide adenylyltransferase [Lysobacter sp.]